MSAAKPKLNLAVQYAFKPETVPTRHQFRKWALAALGCDAEVALRIVDETEGRELNRDYRGKDYATNVLTFPLEDDPILIGDIVLCAPVVEKEATEQGKSLEAHYAHLFIHGMLHMQGYDHENDADAEEMEALETQIVTKLGYPDPYRIEKEVEIING
ncbi:probable rRNA maturation factor [Novimethylophilus kurashikiensis]|uniref:Endoribonuclease YbeY n=1 Tax=Novimethylophilus kurashikiensis TaxID=1825523 RepID=A0A2R5FHG6_9PROT|nr:rRNA maturation RNase YbeY [Novimethylophilus kurashikiensis]GBG15551.1 probable rRNA maturation factor [Novimethylophilus kurashikiensis]